MNNATTRTYWTAGSNVAGYLPESDPYVTSDYENAKRYLIDEMLRDADDLAADGNEDAADELSLAAEDLNLTGPDQGYYLLIDVSPTEHTLPREYWVTRLDPSDAEACEIDDDDNDFELEAAQREVELCEAHERLADAIHSYVRAAAVATYGPDDKEWPEAVALNEIKAAFNRSDTTCALAIARINLASLQATRGVLL